ncbi:MAG: DegV family protein [Oscillospiraceae bacterium]|nr:DegV family protein [Oscillospiraceae bacterium]
MSFSIFTDTSANLPTEYLNKENVGLVVYTYTCRGSEHGTVDTARFDGKRYYEAMRGGMAVSTSLISPPRYAEAFRPALAEGKDLLFIGMSSGISNSQHCATLAAEMLAEEFPERKILLVDTLGASLGEGLLVMRAVRCRAEGMGIEEVCARLLEERRRMCQVFTVDDLLYLRRGGRLSNAAAILGTVLQIKPLLKGDPQGKIVAFQKVRGKKRAIEALAERYASLVEEPETQTVGIAHADCSEDAKYLASLLWKSRPPKEILTVMYEPVTGSHVGPGALALFFFGGDGVREA